MFGAISVDTISDSTPLRRGFSFALYRHGAGLFFLPDSVSATHKRLQRLFCRPCNYTATETKPFTELCSGFSVNLTYSSAHNTATTQAAYAPPAPRRRAYRQALHLHQYPDTAATPDAVQGRAAAYYNKVYKGAAVRPCYGSMPDSATHRRACQPGGLQSGTGQQCRAISLAPSTRRIVVK